MSVLSRQEVKKAIHFDRPIRPPVSDGLPVPWNYREQISDMLEKYHDDTVNSNITVSYWGSPDDDPDYRFAMRGMIKKETISRDNYPVISDWGQLDEFLEQFPGYFYQPSYDKVKGLRDAHPDAYIKVSFGHYLFWRLAELRGLQNFLTDIYDHADKLGIVMDRLLEMYEMWAKKMKEAGADGIHGGEDIGTQRSLFCNPELFREVFNEPYKRLGDIIHRNGMDYWMHSCGNITSIMDDLIDAGVDVIHPIQVGAMNSQTIFNKYKGKICFHAGMDVQNLIPFSDEETIEREVKKRMDLFYMPEGGVIYGAGNVLTEEIPKKNILAYRKTMEEYVMEKRK